jgi:hypothetical protein
MTTEPAPLQLPLSSELAVVLAVAATDDKPGIVVMVFDDEGRFVAVRITDDYSADSIIGTCSVLLDVLAAKHTPGPAIVVAVRPGFGPEDAETELPRLRQCFEGVGCWLVDWLLVTEAGAVLAVESVGG